MLCQYLQTWNAYSSKKFMTMGFLQEVKTTYFSCKCQVFMFETAQVQAADSNGAAAYSGAATYSGPGASSGAAASSGPAASTGAAASSGAAAFI